MILYLFLMRFIALRAGRPIRAWWGTGRTRANQRSEARSISALGNNPACPRRDFSQQNFPRRISVKYNNLAEMSDTSRPPNPPRTAPSSDAASEQDVTLEQAKMDCQKIAAAAANFDPQWTNPQRAKEMQFLHSFVEQLIREKVRREQKSGCNGETDRLHRDAEASLAAKGRNVPLTTEQALRDIERKFDKVTES